MDKFNIQHTLDQYDPNVIEQCLKHGIPIIKKNNEIYSESTLIKKLRQVGGAAISVNNNVDVDPIKNKKKRKKPLKEKANDNLASLDDNDVKDSELLNNPLGPKLDFHIDYKQGRGGQAILEDPLIQAYFKRHNVSKIEPDSEIPVGLAMAIYGNHAQLGDSGLSKYLPNVLDNEELQEYWDSKGINDVTPQTMFPVKFIFLNKGI